MTHMSVLARWGDRPESPRACGLRVESLLGQLGAEMSGPFGEWWTTAFARGQSRKVDLDAAEFGAMFASGGNQTDFGHEPIPELGFSLSLWNGDDECSAAISFTMGATSARWGIPNTCVLELPSARARAWSAEDVLPPVRACAGSLDPEWVGVIRSDWLEVLDQSLEPGAPPAAWVMYVDQKRASRLELTADLEVETLPTGGVIIMTDPDEQAVDIDRLIRLQERWHGAGLLRPISVGPVTYG